MCLGFAKKSSIYINGIVDGAVTNIYLMTKQIIYVYF